MLVFAFLLIFFSKFAPVEKVKRTLLTEACGLKFGWLSTTKNAVPFWTHYMADGLVLSSIFSVIFREPFGGEGGYHLC